MTSATNDNKHRSKNAARPCGRSKAWEISSESSPSAHEASPTVGGRGYASSPISQTTIGSNAWPLSNQSRSYQ
jgi:hypothetical protein